MRALAVCSMLLLAACQRGGSSTTPADARRIASLEDRLGELERRLAEVEDSAEMIAQVEAGVTELLARLDQLKTGGDPRRPDPDAIYSMPIDGDPFLGPEHAKVTMVQAFDFYCGYCDRVRPTLLKLHDEYGDDLKIVFKDFVIHDDLARLPALAACAAHQQGKFMPMFDRIFKEGLGARQELDEARLLAMARRLGLKIGRFKKDMYGACEAEIQADQEQLAAVGTTGTPAFFINGRFLAGALPAAQYRAIIDEELAKAERAIAAGVPVDGYYETIVESGKKSLR